MYLLIWYFAIIYELKIAILSNLHFIDIKIWWKYKKWVRSYYGYKIVEFKLEVPNIQPDYVIYSILALKKFKAKIIQKRLQKRISIFGGRFL